MAADRAKIEIVIEYGPARRTARLARRKGLVQKMMTFRTPLPAFSKSMAAVRTFLEAGPVFFFLTGRCPCFMHRPRRRLLFCSLLLSGKCFCIGNPRPGNAGGDAGPRFPNGHPGTPGADGSTDAALSHIERHPRTNPDAPEKTKSHSLRLFSFFSVLYSTFFSVRLPPHDRTFEICVPFDCNIIAILSGIDASLFCNAFIVAVDLSVCFLPIETDCPAAVPLMPAFRLKPLDWISL